MSTLTRQKKDEDQQRFNIKNKISKIEPKIEQLGKKDWYISIVLTLWSCYIRLWKISHPTSVVFDEVHFGGFASKYIKKAFFMDVHPPLAKLLITWAFQVTGFDGSFDFKEIGKDYLEDKVPYTQVRSFCALNGIMLIPFAYWTIRRYGYSTSTAVLTALMICYENSLITNNRFILLDSILLNFTAMTLLAWVSFSNQKSNSFGLWWWFWLSLTGIGLGLTVSCKWVGLFTIATIGVFVLKELWDLLGERYMSMKTWIQHFLARAVCLIIIPAAIYIFCFKIHFDLLTNAGSGASFMSPEFKSTLNGFKFSHSTPEDVLYGSKITISHFDTKGGYLHSHKHLYPGGSKQQQITLYSHVDKNNVWTITKVTQDKFDKIEYIKNGDIVRLSHLETHRRLHTHDVRPTTNDVKYQYEVSGYGHEGFGGDSNDNWRIEFINDKDDHLRARRTQFRLVSINQDCVLFSRNHKLPDWGFKQQEVTCMKNALLPKTIWRIEDNENDLHPANATMVSYEKKGFFQKFLELNKVMWIVNKGLSSTHSYGSRPKDWPLLNRGISFWTKENQKVYLLGNPPVYWLSSACIIIYLSVNFFIFVAHKRQLFKQIQFQEGGIFVIAWAFHYFPFNLMDRQLFLHHYLPALYMATLLFGVMFEKFTKNLSPVTRWSIAIAVLGLIVSSYYTFAPITYGETWTKEKCSSAIWRPNWDFNCKKYE